MLLYDCGDFKTWPRGFRGKQSAFFFFDLWLIARPPLPPVPFQIAAEGRGAPPCKPGFSEETYKVVLPDIIEKGRPLFNGEWHSISVCYVCCLSVCWCVCQLRALASVSYVWRRIRTTPTCLNDLFSWTSTLESCNMLPLPDSGLLQDVWRSGGRFMISILMRWTFGCLALSSKGGGLCWLHWGHFVSQRIKINCTQS